MSFSRSIQWYHFPVDPIWPDGTFRLHIVVSAFVLIGILQVYLTILLYTHSCIFF
jgi:hypothetical protein